MRNRERCWLKEIAPSKADWFNLIEYLIDAQIYYDERNLIFLRKVSEFKFIKIVVDPVIQNNFGTIKGAKPFLPRIDTMYTLDISTEHPRGSDSYREIFKLPRIR